MFASNSLTLISTCNFFTSKTKIPVHPHALNIDAQKKYNSLLFCDEEDIVEEEQVPLLALNALKKIDIKKSGKVFLIVTKCTPKDQRNNKTHIIMHFCAFHLHVSVARTCM